MAFLSMIIKLGLVIGWLFAAFLVQCSSASSAEESKITIVYFDRAQDPYYAPRLSYGGTYDATRKSSVSGSELAIKDSHFIGQALGKTFNVIHETLPEGEQAVGFVTLKLTANLAQAAILDLPAEDIQAVVKSQATQNTVYFNIRNRSDALRLNTCNKNLFHVIPDDAMLSDALVQFAKSMGWQKALVLSSNSQIDLAQVGVFEKSAQKFGLTITDKRQFVAGSDPRQRDQNNVKLLTGGSDYDVVFVADEEHDFSLRLPYRTYSPRPVIGATGLVPHAWHPLWDRNGAPQLNRRFFKFANRTMTEEDWAAWVAVKSVVEVYSKGETNLEKGLVDPTLTLELYKAYPGSFRTWDHQLRQAILLATSDAVIATAPVEGALHEENNLDTLGLDAPEFICKP